MRPSLVVLSALLVLLVGQAHAVGLAWDGTLIGYVADRPPLPCFGDSCYPECEQAYNDSGNTGPVADACRDHCYLNNGGGGSSGGFPETFMQACMDCASQDIRAAIQLGVYANCKVAKTLSLGGELLDEVIDATGCGEEPETCETSAGNAGSAMQAVADAMGASLGGTVQFLKNPQEKAAYIQKVGKQLEQRKQKK